MFTGIVREVGRVVSAERSGEGLELLVEAPGAAGAASVGDSVAIAGCCLTATAVEDGRLSFHAVPETLARTTLGGLAAGAAVNVEPALRAGEPLGGHYVQGHVDALGRVRSASPEGEGRRLWIELDDELLRFCAEKGSVTVEGVSLTVAEVGRGAFAVALVPHTLEATTLGGAAAGDGVNIEVDVLAKYVDRLLVRHRTD